MTDLGKSLRVSVMHWFQWCLVFKSLVQSGFLTPERGNHRLQLVQTIAHFWRTTIELSRTGPTWFSCGSSLLSLVVVLRLVLTTIFAI